jgi:hypothetical protein
LVKCYTAVPNLYALLEASLRQNAGMTNPAIIGLGHLDFTVTDGDRAVGWWQEVMKRQHADRGYLSHVQVAALADAVERQGEVLRFSPIPGCGGVKWRRCGCPTST